MKTRRHFLFSLLASLPASVLAKTPAFKKPTPAETEGPFYPVVKQQDVDYDLTRIQGRTTPAQGKIILLEGQVLDTRGMPVNNAVVDMWQANAAGRYSHPRDPNTRAKPDPDFQGQAIVNTDKNGQFRFKTIFPGAYPASRDWMRPPHLHFKLSAKGLVGLTTQMYFPDQKLNQSDLLLMQKSDDEIKRMIAQKLTNSPETYSYTVVLQRR